MAGVTFENLKHFAETIDKQFGGGVFHPDIEDIVVTNDDGLDITFADGNQLILVNAYPNAGSDE
tara:strand:+ start:8486 stop:8677 length:192 start_codon:yes stop_codon:yes gene_type:complete